MLKWIGREKGQDGLPGIPARDLSAEEVERYGGAAALLATGLYAEPEKPKRQPKQETEATADDD